MLFHRLFLCLLVAGALRLSAQTPPIRLLFVGDIMLDGGPGHMVTSGGDPFAPTAGLLRDADLTIGNLECSINKAGRAVYKPFQFKGANEALPLLKKYFSAVSLANNHSGDWGREGFSSSLSLLKQHGINYFGGGANRAEALRPLILETRGRRVALLGYNEPHPRSFEATSRHPGSAWLDDKNVLAGIAEARGRLRADYVILYLHWGTEGEDTPEPNQRVQARRFIDAGADAVVGTHPHHTQPVEWYHGKPILYSIGNFVFDYFPDDPPRWIGWAARLTLEPGKDVGLEVFTVEMDLVGVPHLLKPEPDRPSAH